MSDRLRKEALRGKSESGFTLLEVVISIALFFIIGGAFVYAASIAFDARDQSLATTTSTISQGGLHSSFRSDINNAAALKLNSSNNLLIAKTDGTCVGWTLVTPTGATAISILRSSVQGAPVTAGAGSALSSNISSGSFSLDGGSASLTLNYNSGDPFSEVVPLRISGSDGGVCW